MSERSCARIMKIQLSKIKNVDRGIAEFPNNGSINSKAVATKPDITGIYGQNGSGKTTLVEAFDILRYIICAEAVPYDTYAGILPEDETSEIEIFFFVEHGEKKYKVGYNVQLRRNKAQKKIEIAKEVLTYWIRGASWKAKRTLSFQNPLYNHFDILKENNDPLYIDSSDREKLGATPFGNPIDKLALICAQNNVSIFFNEIIRNALLKPVNDSEFSHMRDIIHGLYQFGYVDFNVIESSQLGTIHSGRTIPIHTHSEENGVITRGIIHLQINGITNISEKDYPQVKTVIQSINTALSAIVPRLQIELSEESEVQLPNGEREIRVEAFANRDGKRFQLCFESEGIKRIISILNYLIAVYNQSGVCLVIDELDSGIFEYLLGELLGMMRQGIKGQLIFTSHNLRIMEKLDAFSILCTTVNPNDRYIRLLGIEKNHNHRDFYIRALTVGGQKEELYNEEDLSSLGYAFRKAGNREEMPTIAFSDEFLSLLQNSSEKGVSADAK